MDGRVGRGSHLAAAARRQWDEEPRDVSVSSVDGDVSDGIRPSHCERGRHLADALTGRRVASLSWVDSLHTYSHLASVVIW